MKIRNLRINLRTLEITVEELVDDGVLDPIPQGTPLLDPPADRTPHPIPATRAIPVEALKVEPYGAETGAHQQDHNFELVSRHHIAESGLICPRCKQEVCGRADFSKVRIFVSPSGKRNEGVRCDCIVKREGMERPCGAILLACPDTEHGDNLLLDTGKVPESEMHLFKRKDEAEAIREKYGVDIQRVGHNEFKVTGPEPLHPTPLAQESPPCESLPTTQPDPNASRPSTNDSLSTATRKRSSTSRRKSSTTK